MLNNLRNVIKVLSVTGLLLTWVAGTALAQAHTRLNADGSIREVSDAKYQRVRTVLERFEEGAFAGDIALFKLAIDKALDPNTEVVQTINQLDQMVFAIRDMAGPDATEERLLGTLRTYIYEAGEWNDGNPFTYDHQDPLGTNLENKLLSTYLESRRGNCVSMPTLVLILGRRLGMDMTLATAPNHVFIKYRPKGASEWVNLEATSGANPSRDVWLRQNFNITDLSVQSGLYMRPLSEDALAASIAATAIESAYSDGRFWDTILIAEDLRAMDDRNLTAILFRGSALSKIMEEDWHQQWPNPNDAPTQFSGRYQSYVRQRDIDYEYAFRLGFEQEDQGR